MPTSKNIPIEPGEFMSKDIVAAKRAATIDEIFIADEPSAWEALGFAVSDEVLQLGTVRIVLTGRNAGQGITGWSLRGVTNTELDGLPTTLSTRSSQTYASDHPNGVGVIDHIVTMSPELDRSIQRLQLAGLDLRRIRERPTPAGAPRQAFFRLGEVILEVIQEPAEVLEHSGAPHGPTRFWGLALVAEDIDSTVRGIGEHVSELRPAVQYGRRIATLKRSAGLAIPVALMSPAVA